MAFALNPAAAAKHAHPLKATAHKAAGKSGGKATGRGKAAAKAAGKHAGKAAGKRGDKAARKAAASHGHALAAPTARAAPPLLKPASSERRQDRSLNTAGGQFLTALWRIDPEAAIAAGKYDTAANLSIPDQDSRQRQLAFIEEWQARLAKIDARQLSAGSRTDLALLTNKLSADRWRLTELREFEWNPALYNIAGPIDLILHTEYAAQPQRLRTLLKRIANVPAYYAAARASIVNPTSEHTRLAIVQNGGVPQLLAELDQVAQASILSPVEKQLYTERIAAARAAVDAYVLWLGGLDNTLDKGGARSFRLGKELYEQKFAYDLQNGAYAAQMYQKALAARDQVLQDMSGLADELWGKTMGETARPGDRYVKIGMVVERLSARHVARADYLPETRRQIAQLRDWVNEHKLLTLDAQQAPLVRDTPPYQRGLAGAGIEMPGPYRPQDRGYYNLRSLEQDTPEQAEARLREYNYWTLQLNNMHETIPGRYVQLGYANHSQSIIKTVFGNRDMSQGWAVYSAHMMLETGYGENTPEMRLMYAKWHLRSITDAILDYGVHVLGMTREQAFEMLTRQAFQTPREADEKWRLVQLTSVQLSSGFTGYSDIMEWREQRKQALGNQFVLHTFHLQLLSFGNSPLRFIKELSL